MAVETKIYFGAPDMNEDPVIGAQYVNLVRQLTLERVSEEATTVKDKLGVCQPKGVLRAWQTVKSLILNTLTPE